MEESWLSRYIPSSWWNRKSQVSVAPESHMRLAIGNWVAFGATVRGASHEKSGLPNQDYIDWWPKSVSEPPIAMAISDGHGNNRCFRSEIGSQLAVDTSLQIIREFLKAQPGFPNPSVCKRAAEEMLPEELERRWKSVVQEHLKLNPLLASEVRALEDKEGIEVRKKVEAKPEIAYGCTLLFAIVDSTYIICVQIGDGDMLAVAENGEVTRPMPEDSRHFANETTSLSSSKSRNDFRVCFQHLAGSPPLLLLLCTDGYTNAFASDLDFLNVGREFVDSLREDGVETVSGYLHELLVDASLNGSGDDVTLGVLFRSDSDSSQWPDWRTDQATSEKTEQSKSETGSEISMATSQGHSEPPSYLPDMSDLTEGMVDDEGEPLRKPNRREPPE